MIVKCINTYGWYNLTIGKTYEVITQDKWFYKIINDNGKEDLFPKVYYKPLSEIRAEKIDKLLR